MKRSILCLLTAVFTAFAMQGYSAEEHSTEEHSHGHQSHGAATALPGLSLNNGERWQTDDHTRMLSQTMRKTFFAADHTTLEGLNSAGTLMGQQVQELIAGCTMTGAAHDQLHLFLNQHIPTINALKAATDYSVARDNAILLKGQLETYRKHFQ